ncbi:corticosteroid 11-beta-dehydrogenase isozyme 2 isoform B [Alligator mississippiensis]|uniref:11-beta-hydroxysteroid dehydrogenase type 2 n=1 Tax=Alligator mississippiensis TaxID=8496 RepID=A0A151NE45_ALLMI|nr:corticosteroid 11-beta-dehydrogenase isozyme 2 isoform B [Alligator mississippiensis]
MTGTRGSRTQGKLQQDLGTARPTQPFFSPPPSQKPLPPCTRVGNSGSTGEKLIQQPTSGNLLVRLSHTDLLLTPALFLYLVLLVLLQWLCDAYLPLFLGVGFTSAACCFVLGRATQRRLLPVAGKAIFITGCDSGFGKETARHLDSMGFKVFASVLDLESSGAKELRQSCSPRLTLLEMDLTKTEDIQRALQLIQTQTKSTGLWGLVNNAGFNDTIADAELSPLCKFRICMEVNFFGSLELTKGLLPLLRSSAGRIVTISSPAGDMPYPCLAAYGASKAALGLLMDTFRSELQPWGIKVSLILPGYFKTGTTCDLQFWHLKKQQLLASLPTELLQAYGEEYIEEINRQFVKFMKVAVEDLSTVVTSITDALISANPATRFLHKPQTAQSTGAKTTEQCQERMTFTHRLGEVV